MISSGYGLAQETATSNFSSTTTPIVGWVTLPATNLPLNLSPSNANVTPTPTMQFTTVAPSLNGYGEYQLSPGQVIDVLVTMQLATLAPSTLTITNSVSSRT